VQLCAHLKKKSQTKLKKKQIVTVVVRQYANDDLSRLQQLFKNRDG
jgi:hypothetical protein